jgi:hypothetical protein
VLIQPFTACFQFALLHEKPFATGFQIPANGVLLAAYLPLLKTYLGHYSFQDTAYYLRLTAELYPDITARVEQPFGYVVPDVDGVTDETD